MSHDPSNTCPGCRAVAALKIVDDSEVALIHMMTRNLVEHNTLLMQAIDNDFEFTDEVMDFIEISIMDCMATQPPSSDSQH